MTTHIMVVDDEPVIGKLLMYQLHTLGYEVTYVQDGLLALQRLEREQPDLVLLDVMMPAISGWEVCQQIRASSSVPIIMLTAKHSDTDVVTGLTAGADDYIAKPCSMPQLQARIEAVLRRTQPAPRASRVVGEPVQRAARSTPLENAVSVAPARRAPVKDAPAAPAVPKRAAAAPQAARATRAPVAAVAQGIGASQSNGRTRLGPLLRETRLAKGFSLYQIGSECKIHWEFLQAIEQENFSYVPRKQLHNALHAYTGYLGLNLNELIGRSSVVPPRARWTHEYRFIVVALLLIVVASAILLSVG